MNADLPITLSQLRKQGELLVAYGRRIVAAGEQQIEAATKIEESYALLPQSLSLSPSPLSVVDGESPDILRHRREYISAVNAAQISLKDGPLETCTIYDRVITMGARCSNHQSLVAMMVQHPDKFERAGLKKWKLVDVKSTEKFSENGTRLREG